jgi:SAM-dependent methyltransferase
MHEQARKFTIYVKNILPDFFRNKVVLDVGSGDINGNNKFLFENCEYVGNDVYDGPNVTIVSKTTALQFQDGIFDTIISTECFEHDPEYQDSFRKIVKMLKPDGLFLFTCASTGRPEHGTRRTSPGESYGTIGNIDGWTDYYKNLTFEDLDLSINVKETFSTYITFYNSESHDLYFAGIKKGTSNYNIPPYSISSKPKFIWSLKK